MARPNRMDSPFLISRGAMPSSARVALKQLQPRAEATRLELVRSLRQLAKALEREATEVERGSIRPTQHMIAPYAAVLDGMRAEANLLREWTHTLRGEIVGPVTPYLGTPVIPSMPLTLATDVAAVVSPEEELVAAGPSISDLMDQVAEEAGIQEDRKTGSQ